MIRFLLKGLLRDRSRSLLPFFTVVLGSALTVIGYSWINGAMSSMIESGARFSTGHVKVMSRAYAKEADQAPNDLALAGVGGLLDELARDHPEFDWAPRITFGGLIDIPDERGETRVQGPVAGLAVDLRNPASPERGLLNLDKAVVRGRLPEQPGEILLSDGFAARLGLDPGATATLISATMYGSLVVQNFVVAGTVRFGVAVMDRGAMIADIADIRGALDMDDSAGQILGFFRDAPYMRDEAGRAAAAFNLAHGGDGGEFAPLMVSLHEQSGLAQMLDWAAQVYSLMLVCFILVMSIVLWNAGLMSSLRRYGEFGIRLALGEDHGRLYRSLIAEGVIVGLVGSVVGTALGLAVSYYLQYKGFDLGSMLRNASIIVTDVLRARVTPGSYAIGFVPGLAATFLGKAVSGIGIYKRQTSRLAKEFEA
ncbi:MAG: FtsX-like permease family protein [Vicinamibacterales bacterium]